MTTPAPKKQPVPFGKYLLLDRINIGGMAEVWRGKQFGTGGVERLVAIKRILPNIAEDEEFIRMFIDEAKISVQLTHANIAQIYELGHIQNSYFIAMEYIAGKDLRAIFERCRKKGEPAPIPLSCYVIAKLCEGLDYAHRKKDNSGRDMNIVHRDVSPQNVLLSYDGEIKVIDFGIAKAAGKATKTQAGILKGKFGYMSPEQIRGLPLDRRSDVFAIGVCLYEVLTGERLFVGESDFSVLEKVRKAEVAPPSKYNRKIPEMLEKIVLKALAKDVDQRYQYANELGDDLQRFLITSDSIFGRKELVQYMKTTFPEDVERERIRLQEYQEIKAPEGMISEIIGAPGNSPSRSFPSLRPPGASGERAVPSGAHAAVAGAGATSGPRRGMSLTNLPRVQPTPPPPQPPPPQQLGDEDAIETHTVLSEPVRLPNPFDDSPEPATMPGSLAAYERLNALGRPSGSRPVVPGPSPAPAAAPGLVARRPTQPSLSPLETMDADSPEPEEPPDPIDGPTRPPFEMKDILGDETGPGYLYGPGDSQYGPGDSQYGSGDSQSVTGQMLPVALQTQPAARSNLPSADEAEAPPRKRSVWGYVLLTLMVLGLAGSNVYILFFRERPTGFIYVDVPSELHGKARVNVNGTELGTPSSWPVLQKVPVGAAIVMVTADGFQPFTMPVEIREGRQITTVRAELKSAFELGKLLVSTEPDQAQVKLNGTVVKAASAPGPYYAELPIGVEQSLEISFPGYKPRVEAVTLKDAGPLKLTVKLEGTEVPIAVSSEPPGASILVNGKEVGVTPATLKVVPGVQAVTLTKRCFDRVEVPLHLPAERGADPIPVRGSLRRQPGCR